MKTTPAILARQQKKMRRKLQDGVIISWTTMTHPHKTIGLIELADGICVFGTVVGTPVIGARVRSRMALSHVNPEGLRIYDVAYEAVAAKPVPTEEERIFPGYILALTGPSGVGKTTVSRLLVNVMSDYIESVPILTTRARKTGDDGEYRYVSKEKFTEYLNDGDIVSFAHLPSVTEERWYGYRKQDIEKIWQKGKLPVVITEMHLLRGLSEHFGRRSIVSFGLLPPGKSKRAMLSSLLHRLRERGRDAEEHIKDRLKNAVRDLDFFRQRADLFDRILVNENLHAVVETVRKVVPGLQAKPKN
jgi:guanylate kinase